MNSSESSPYLGKYWLIFQRRWLPATAVFVTVFAAITLAAFMKKPVYIAEGKLRFQRINTTSSLTGLGREIGSLEPLAERSNPMNTEAEVIRSVPVVQKTIDKLQLKDKKGVPLKLKEFFKRLTVNNLVGSDIVKVAYEDTNPETAAQVVNTLMDAYIEHNISYNRTEATAARKFIDSQLPQAEATVRKAEISLRQFKEKNKVVALQEEANRGVEVIAELQKRISETESEIADVNAKSQAIRQQLAMNSQEAVSRTSISQAPGVQDLLKEVQQIESELAAKRTIFQDAHPQIVSLQGRLSALKTLLKERVGQVVGTPQPNLNGNLQLGALKQQLTAQLVELESTRLGLISEAAALSNLQADYRKRLNILPRLEQQQRELERKLEAGQATYSLLLQRLQESRIAEHQNVGNVRMISPAKLPQEPASSRIVAYLSAGLLGMLSALATIYLLEAKDKSIKTVEQAKALLPWTLLGIIPNFSSHPKKSPNSNENYLSDNHRLVVRDMPRSPISEAYRMLRANLKFVSADKELKVIVVTSSVPKEGKSTVAANLAIALAQMERKVLLIDADLHRPVQHTIWGQLNNLGLSNVIVGQTELSTAIKPVMDNLHVLTAGALPPSPASLLDSRRMAGLIENLAGNYDYTIIDTPSLNVAADAATIGQMADGVLFIVRPEVVDTLNATVAKELLEKSGQNVLGQVVNGILPKNEPHSYFYFSQEYNTQESATKEEVRVGMGNG
jgi:capsular exopolysaccharide synthesis family protein